MLYIIACNNKSFAIGNREVVGKDFNFCIYYYKFAEFKLTNGPSFINFDRTFLQFGLAFSLSCQCNRKSFPTSSFSPF